MNEKEMMSKVLKSYIKDLREGKKPKAFEMFKENPDLAKEISPLIHIARLSMIKEGTMKKSDMNPEKSKKLSNELINKVKQLKNHKQKETSGLRNIRPALAYRKNDKESEEEGNYTSEAIDKLMKKMDNKSNKNN